jgi:hypothetical protein
MGNFAVWVRPEDAHGVVLASVLNPVLLLGSDWVPETVSVVASAVVFTCSVARSSVRPFSCGGSRFGGEHRDTLIVRWRTVPSAADVNERIATTRKDYAAG